MSDLPVGRIGCVMDGLGDGTSGADAARVIRCNGCRTWFSAAHAACPECEHRRPGFSKPIRTAQLNRHLYEQAGLRAPSGDFRA